MAQNNHVGRPSAGAERSGVPVRAPRARGGPKASSCGPQRRGPQAAHRLVALAGVLVVLAGRCGLAQVTPSQLIGRAVAEPDSERYKEVATAIARFFQGDGTGARVSLAAAKGKNPQLPPVGVMLAQLLFAANRVAEARAELEKTVVDHPDDPEAYLLFGDLALRDGRLTDAQSLYERGTELCAKVTQNPLRKRNLQIGARAGLAAVANARRQWPQAEQYARQWLAMDPQSAQAQVQLARALFFQKQYQRAFEAFKAAYKANPDSPRPEINMALLYEELVARGQPSKRASARKAIQSAVEHDPDNLLTRLAAARWALEACEIDMAEQNAAAARKIDPNSFDAQLLAGLVARHRKDLPTAETAFRSAHLLAPANFSALGQLVLALIEQPDGRKHQLALQYAELNFRANRDDRQPAGREAAVTLAWVLFRLGRRADALATIQAAVRAGALQGETAYLAARVLSDSGRTEAALRVLQPALRDAPCFPTRGDAEALLAKLKENRVRAE